MYSVDEALEKILQAFALLPAERIPLAQGLGRILAEPITARENLPPFDNSSMDGYALIAADAALASAQNPITLKVVADIPAGTASDRVISRGEAARIMTGAPLPPGADCVIPIEDTDNPPGKFTESGAPLPGTITLFRAVQPGDYVRFAGEDIRPGDLILKKGRVLRPADLGALAGLGVPQVQVIRRPRIAILSTGDELLRADQPLVPGKIRDINSYALAASVLEMGAQVISLGTVPDQLEAVLAKLEEAIRADADLILSSAGVSVGAFDVVKTAMESLGTLEFWKVNMRPGRPLAFGRVGSIPFIGLPGNPVSALITFEVFARPAIRKMQGLSLHPPLHEAETAEDMESDGRRTYARVRLERDQERLIAWSTGTQSSGAIHSMVQAQGLLIIPEGMKHIPTGTKLPVRIFEHFEDET